jgi:4-aminobutyrate aminotransferase-like enzyme
MSLTAFASVKDIRGAGLMIGIEMNEIPLGRTPMEDLIKNFLLEMLKKGAAISSSSSTIRITPPLSLTKSQAEWLAHTIEGCISSTFEAAFLD